VDAQKLQSECHRQETNIQLFTGRMPFLLPNQQCRNTEETFSATAGEENAEFRVAVGSKKYDWWYTDPQVFESTVC